MKVTLKDLWGARGTLAKLSGMPFRAKTAYRLMKLIDQANKEIEPFAKVRQELFLKYGDQEGELVTIKPENVEAFTAELAELENQTVELKFTVSLEEIEEAKLTPSEIYDLAFLFTDEIAASQ